jgi:hypothetical protein
LLLKFFARADDMWPLPQAGSQHEWSPSDLCAGNRTCFISARVAHGGVGKSSRLLRASILCAITAWDPFPGLVCRLLISLSPRMNST